LKIRDFIKKTRIETVEDISMQVEAWAYIIAKHYGISLLDVYSMPESLFRQSLNWAMAIGAEEGEEQKRSNQRAKSKGNETVNLDYSFLDKEDI